MTITPSVISLLAKMQAFCVKRKTPVHVVGGFLRDALLGRSSTDLDFIVSAKAIAIARHFANDIKGAFVLLDQEHGCARVVKRIDGVPWTFDFADYRAKTLKGDLALRDFTINTLVLPLADFLKDDWIKRIKDTRGALDSIQKRTIHLNYAKAFSDDPLRLIRAFSLQAYFGFKLDKAIIDAVKRQTALIDTVSVERVRDELFKILSSRQSHKAIVALDRVGLLMRIIPQMSVMRSVEQGGTHHLDVWQHSLEVLKQFEIILEDLGQDNRIATYFKTPYAGGHSRRALYAMACLLHDIGKPQTKQWEKDRYTFHGHEHVGATITRTVGRRLKCAVKEYHLLEDLVRWHLRPGYLTNFEKPTPRAMFRYLRDTDQEALGLAVFAIADQRATCGPLTTQERSRHHEAICRSVIAEVLRDKDKPKRARLITGHDLIKTLKLKPSPVFAKILSTIEEAQALGKISTRQEALEMAKSILEK